jgi:adenylate cyclase class 2
MKWEVEQKFPLDDVPATKARLLALGTRFSDPIQQSDRYFNHPSRDFRSTDEALRLRQIGAENFITYKGPKIDQDTKTRRELELPLPPGPQIAQELADLLTVLGFQPVATVRKTRRSGNLTWEGYAVEVALDEVQAVGSYLELEIMADDSTLDGAKTSLQRLSKHLNLGPSERRSYLEMLLERKS